jgi:hypothetical protein
MIDKLPVRKGKIHGCCGHVCCFGRYRQEACLERTDAVRLTIMTYNITVRAMIQ